MNIGRYITMPLFSIVAVALSASANAQSISAEGIDGTVNAADPGSRSPSDFGSGTENDPDMIIVTATKRDESLVEVPIQMSVFTADAITDAGIVRPADFLTSVPNVTFIEDNAGEAYVNIRGQTATRSSDPNVAYVIDGVTLSSVKGFNQDLFDIQQIEVLKGPQSAIYGRNAAAGAIVITTKRPGNDFEGSILAGIGNDDSYRANLGVSGPITQNLFYGLAGSYRHTDGSYTGVNTGEKVQRSENYSGRGRLVYDNDAGLVVDLKFGVNRSVGGGSSLTAQIVGVPLPGFDGLALDANNTDIPYLSDRAHQYRATVYDASLKVEYDMGFAELTSVTGWNHINEYFGSQSPPYIPGTGTLQQYTYKDENISEEIRLTSPGDQRLRWQVGFYYLRFDRDQTSDVIRDDNGILPSNPRDLRLSSEVNPSLSYDNPIYRTTSYAPFASIQYDITDELHFSLAGRYDTEKRTIRNATLDAINPLTGVNYNNCVALTGQSIDQCVDAKTFHQFEPKVSLSYDIGDDASIYASYGRGFKSGGFNPIGARQALQQAAINAGIDPSTVYVQDIYEKEVSSTYEIGAKARLFDRRLSLNAAVFTTDISNAPQFQFFPASGLQTTISIDKVRSRGFEFDANLKLPNGLNIFGGYGYTDAVVKEFSPDPTFNGNRAPGSNKYTLNAGMTMVFDLGDSGLELVPRIEYNRQGSIWWDVANTPGTKRNPIDIVDARLTLKQDDRWQIAAFGNNIFNEKYFLEVVPLLGSFIVNYPAARATYGVEARFNF